MDVGKYRDARDFIALSVPDVTSALNDLVRSLARSGEAETDQLVTAGHLKNAMKKLFEAQEMLTRAKISLED